MPTLIFGICLALGVSFVCSFIEAGLLSLTPSDVAALNQEAPREGKIWYTFKQNIGRPISVILLLNTSAHTIGAAVAGAKFGKLYGDHSLWVFSLVFTYVMLQYTEILPKTLGVRFRMFMARTVALPLDWSVRILSPVIRLIHWINRPFEKKTSQHASQGSDTISEITSLAAMARMSKEIGRRQERIIFSATHLAGITAQGVMIPVDQVMFLSTKNTIQEAFLMAHVDLHTRYPVMEGENLTDIVGYINFKELVYFMSTNPNNPSLSGIIRPLTFVQPETNASDLLKLFVDQHNHMVVVREDGGPALGIVTVEDVLEEFVGEIEDEFDRLPQYVHRLEGGVWLAGGGAAMDAISSQIGLPLGRPGELLNEWLSSRLPQGFTRGSAIREGKYEFAVRRIKRGKIFDAAISDMEPVRLHNPKK